MGLCKCPTEHYPNMINRNLHCTVKAVLSHAGAQLNLLVSVLPNSHIVLQDFLYIVWYSLHMTVVCMAWWACLLAQVPLTLLFKLINLNLPQQHDVFTAQLICRMGSLKDGVEGSGMLPSKCGCTIGADPCLREPMVCWCTRVKVGQPADSVMISGL